MIFLLDYDRAVGELVSIREFDVNERTKASKSRLDLEIELLAKGINREVVLLEAESEEALRKTHNRYFRNVSGLADSARTSVKLKDPEPDKNR